MFKTDWNEVFKDSAIRFDVDGVSFYVGIPQGKGFNSITTVVEYVVDDTRHTMLTSTDLDELLPLFGKIRDKDNQVLRAIAEYHQLQSRGKYSFLILGYDKWKKAPYIRGEVA